MKVLLGIYTLILCFIILISCSFSEKEKAKVELNAGKIDSALQLILEAVNTDSSDCEVWYVLGKIYYAKNSIKEMIEAFNRSISINDRFQPEIENIKNECYNKYYDKGMQYYNEYFVKNNKQDNEAKQLLENVINNLTTTNLIKKEYIVNQIIARAFHYLGDNENDLKYLLSASEIKPDTAQAWIDLGIYFYNQEDYQKAVEYFKKGLSLGSLKTEYLTLYTQSLINLDKPFEAEKIIKTIDKRNKEKALPYNLGFLFFNKALKLHIRDKERIKLLEKSIKYLDRAHQMDRRLESVYTSLSFALIELKKYNEAIELCEEGVALFPINYSIWRNLCAAYSKTGKTEKSKEACKKADQLKKNR